MSTSYPTTELERIYQAERLLVRGLRRLDPDVAVKLLDDIVNDLRDVRIQLLLEAMESRSPGW